MASMGQAVEKGMGHREPSSWSQRGVFFQHSLSPGVVEGGASALLTPGDQLFFLAMEGKIL